MKLKEIITDVLTEADGLSFDWGAVLGALIVLVFLGISVFVYCYLKQDFEPVAWGTGGAGIFGGVGGYTFLKGKSAPKDDA